MSLDLNPVRDYLKHYDGPDINLMEVCGSHTGAIAKNGIPSLLSDKIHLISGPGCPVCVCVSSYIDRLIELSLTENTCVVTFGDLIRVPGSQESLSIARGRGARVRMVYSPMETLDLAEKDPATTFVFAAVGFETTAPVYALLVKETKERHLSNVKLLTAIKTMPAVIDSLCSSHAPVDGFLAPGHVCAVTGYTAYEALAKRYHLPFVVCGFTGPELLIGLTLLVKYRGQGIVKNAYPRVVTKEGNREAQALMQEVFEPAPAAWRGLGIIENSGLVLTGSYASCDAGSRDLSEDNKKNRACICDQVLTGRKKPVDCPLFKKVCSPMHPQGACMVSQEGSCFTWLASGRQR